MKKLFVTLFLILTGLFGSSQVIQHLPDGGLSIEFTSGQQFGGSLIINDTMLTGKTLTISQSISGSINNIFYVTDSFSVFSDHLPYDTLIYWQQSITFFVINVNTNKSVTINLFVKGPYFSVNENTTDLFSIYPNPTTDVLNITGDLTGKIFEVIDITGKSLIKTSDKLIDVSNLTSGVYFLRVGNSVRRVIKK